MASTGSSSRSARVSATKSEPPTKIVKMAPASDSAVSSSKPTTRRDVLIRQPSYCKILDDLKGTEARVANLKEEGADEPIEVSTSVESEESEDALAHQQPVQTITINGQQYQIVSPSALSPDGNIQTLTIGAGGVASGASSASTSPSGVIQYAAASQNGQTVFIPGTVAAAATSPQIISVASSASTSGSGAGSSIEEATRKREIRLLKNREAARECRNKKKEYIKCLENRVGKESCIC